MATWRPPRFLLVFLVGCASCGARSQLELTEVVDAGFVMSEVPTIANPSDASTSETEPHFVPLVAPPCGDMGHVTFSGGAGWSLAAANDWIHFGNTDGLWEQATGSNPTLVLPTDYYEPVAIVESNDAVFWSSDGIYQMVPGHPPPNKLADLVTEGLSVDASYVYFATWAAVPTTLYRMRRDGSELEALKVYRSQALIRHIVADDHYLYAGDFKTDADEPLLKIAKDGSGETTLATVRLMGPLERQDDVLYWTEQGNQPPYNSVLRRVKTSGEGLSNLLRFEGIVFDIAVRGEFLYVTHHELADSVYSGHLQRMTVAGENVCELANFAGIGLDIATTPESTYVITSVRNLSGELIEAPR